MTDYQCAKFGDFSFSRFGFIMQTNRHKHTQRGTEKETDTQNHIQMLYSHDYRQLEALNKDRYPVINFKTSLYNKFIPGHCHRRLKFLICTG